MSKYTYKTTTTKAGNIHRFRCWVENFKDEDTGRLVPIKRSRLIKVNGRPVTWIPGARIGDRGTIPAKEMI